MKVALVHDWLTGMRGGERCLESFVKLYPECDIFTLVHVPGRTSPTIDARVVGVSWLNRLPGVSRYYRALLPFFPSAARSLNLNGYDLVISLSHAAAKNVTVPRGTPHICYCFTPMRYIWDQAPYYFGSLSKVIDPLLGLLRRWDLAGSRNVTHFVAISKFVAARIRCFYGRSATVIYPPVATEWVKPGRPGRVGEAFLYAGALVPYKRPDLVIEAFNRCGERLWVAGSGPEEKRLKKMAGKNIDFFGAVSDHELAELYASCRALIFPGTEDFGMVPIECLAAGRPVIANYSGALRESLPAILPWRVMRAGETGSARKLSSEQIAKAAGVFYKKLLNSDDEITELLRAVTLFIEHESEFSPATCVAAAKRFSSQRFIDDWEKFAASVGIAPNYTPAKIGQRFEASQISRQISKVAAERAVNG